MSDAQSPQGSREGGVAAAAGGDGEAATDLAIGVGADAAAEAGEDASAEAGMPASGDAGTDACVPSVTPHGVAVVDQRGRVLNARGIHLVDWDGFLANAAPTLTLRPPPDITFPATATLHADQQRLYFDLPSTTGANGPTKSVRFDTAQSTVRVRIGIFPDRDGVDEQYLLAVTLDGTDPRPEHVPITVHDQDQNRLLDTRIVVDFSQDKTGFFASPEARAVLQQAADDWSYFLKAPSFDPVPAGDEPTFIWHADGFVGGDIVRNAQPFTGFLLYAYGIHSSALRSGGEGSSDGKAQTSSGVPLPLRRSGGLEVETQGNYNALGWVMDIDPDTWWISQNLGDEKNDLLSIVHHEMGHAHGFNQAYPQFLAARAGGLTSPAVEAYLGHPLVIDASDHFDGTIDPDSGFGAFGNEYHGVMPLGRWLITRVDLLALEAIGYSLRTTSFDTWQDNIADCP